MDNLLFKRYPEPLFQCSSCSRVDDLFVHRDLPCYPRTACCGARICNDCDRSKASSGTLTCMLCSIETTIRRISKIDRMDAAICAMDQCANGRYHGSLLYGGYRLLIPFTATKKFGSWREISKIVGWAGNPNFQNFFESYIKYANNFCDKQLLFYLLSSSCVKKLQHSAFVRPFVPSRTMLDFFDIQKWYLNVVSRKLFLKQNQFGFIILVIERLSVLNLSSVNRMHKGNVFTAEDKFRTSTKRYFNRILHAFLSGKKS